MVQDEEEEEIAGNSAYIYSLLWFQKEPDVSSGLGAASVGSHTKEKPVGEYAVGSLPRIESSTQAGFAGRSNRSVAVPTTASILIRATAAYTLVIVLSHHVRPSCQLPCQPPASLSTRRTAARALHVGYPQKRDPRRVPRTRQSRDEHIASHDSDAR